MMQSPPSPARTVSEMRSKSRNSGAAGGVAVTRSSSNTARPGLLPFFLLFSRALTNEAEPGAGGVVVVLEADRINHERMKMDMGGGKTMEHDDPNSVLLEPGKSGEIIWKFTKATELEFACNVPGHYDAGMMGRLHFK